MPLVETAFQVVDAFTDKAFAGNPAAVMILEKFPADDILFKISREFNLSETAFIVPKYDGSTHEFHLRWFTPTAEVPLCGHATLASSHVLFTQMTEKQRQSGPLRFHTLSGELSVEFKTAAPEKLSTRNEMSLPELVMTPDSSIDRNVLCDAFGITENQILFVGSCHWGVLVEIDASTTPLHAIKPNFKAIASVNASAILLATQCGTDLHGEYDFISRMFAPNLGVNEDPVCGSAHSVLAHYYANKLKKSEFKAFQASARGGEIHVVYDAVAGRVRIAGDAVTVSKGVIYM